MLSRFVPSFKLTVEEALQGAIHRHIVLTSYELLACRHFKRAQTVFVQIVGIHLFHAQGGIAVAIPTAAEVEFVVDSAYTVLATECKSEGIILAITCVGELYLPYKRREECTRRTKSVYAQGVVRTVLVSPLTMVDESWRQRFEFEVAHTVASYNHSRPLTIEFIDDTLQCLRRRIEVVAVELHRKASTTVVIHRHIPASSDTEVGAVWYYMYKTFVCRRHIFKDSGSGICRMIINDNHIIFECRFLFKSRIYGISHSAFTVEHGYHDRGFHIEILFPIVNLGILRSVHQCAYLLQMVCHHLLHFHLYITVSRIRCAVCRFPGVCKGIH